MYDMDEGEWERLDAIARNGGVRAARFLLFVLAAVSVGLGLWLAVWGLADRGSLGTGGPPEWLLKATGGLGGCMGITFAAADAYVASALGAGRRWAWFAGIVLGALYVPTLVLPLGVLIVVGLTRPDTKALFGKRRKAAA